MPALNGDTMTSKLLAELEEMKVAARLAAHRPEGEGLGVAGQPVAPALVPFDQRLPEVNDDHGHGAGAPELAHGLFGLCQYSLADPARLRAGIDRKHAKVSAIAATLEQHAADQAALDLGEEEAALGIRD